MPHAAGQSTTFTGLEPGHARQHNPATCATTKERSRTQEPLGPQPALIAPFGQVDSQLAQSMHFAASIE
jgi:hypothetical protein